MTNHVILYRMPGTTKGNTLRLYLNDEDLKLLRELSDCLEISQTDVMSRVMAAGLRAIALNGYRMPLPLKFEVVNSERVESYQLNELKPKGRK